MFNLISLVTFIWAVVHFYKQRGARPRNHTPGTGSPLGCRQIVFISRGLLLDAPAEAHFIIASQVFRAKPQLWEHPKFVVMILKDLRLHQIFA